MVEIKGKVVNKYDLNDYIVKDIEDEFVGRILDGSKLFENKYEGEAYEYTIIDEHVPKLSFKQYCKWLGEHNSKHVDNQTDYQDVGEG